MHPPPTHANNDNDSTASKAAAEPLALSEDAAVVLRLVCKPTSRPQNILLTLESLAKARPPSPLYLGPLCLSLHSASFPLLTATHPITITPTPTHQAAEGLKAEQRSVQIEVVGAPSAFTHPATTAGGVEVTLLNMPFEAARTRSQIQPKDTVVTLPVGARLADGATTLKTLLAHASASATVAFPLAVDGTPEALPSLGSLAELNFIGPKRRPCALVGSARYDTRHPTLSSAWFCLL
jgi:hypothetical protein